MPIFVIGIIIPYAVIMRNIVWSLLAVYVLASSIEAISAPSVLIAEKSFSPAPPPVPTMELLPQYCGVMDYTTNDLIKSTQVPYSQTQDVAYYQFRFVELEAPFNTYEVVSPNGTNPNFRLEWFDEIQYGRTYEVSVRIALNPGAELGTYGPSCIIGLVPNVLTTQLEAQYGNGIFNFCDIIGADPVGGADQYRWVFDDLFAQVEAYGDSYYRLIRLSDVEGLSLGQTYVVRVFAEVNGQEGPVGQGRFMSTNNFVPNTGLRTDLYPCGGTYPLNFQVQAVEVCNASSYTWRFNNTSQAQEELIYTRVGGNRFIRLEWVEGLIPGDSYDLDVKVNQGGLSGDYSSVCNITIDGPITGIAPPNDELNIGDDYETTLSEMTIAGGVELDVVKSSLDNGTVTFTLSSDMSEQMTVELLDMNGRIVGADRINALTEPTQHDWSIPGLVEGIYVLRAYGTQGVKSTKIAVF